jgi:hypothetical protein
LLHYDLTASNFLAEQCIFSLGNSQLLRGLDYVSYSLAMSQYYLLTNGQTTGPFSFAELLPNGLRSTSLIQQQGHTTWQAARELPELAALLSCAPQSLTPSDRLTTQLTHSGFRLPAVFAQNSAAWVAGGVVSILLSFLVASCISGESAREQAIMTQLMADARHDSVMQQEREHLRAQAEELRRARQRLWSREHFMEYVQAEVLPGYRVVGFGGIADGHVRFTNNSGYRVRDVLLAIEYIKADGDVYKVEYAHLEDVRAHESEVVEVPESSRGTSLRCSIQGLRAPALDFQYSAL